MKQTQLLENIQRMRTQSSFKKRLTMAVPQEDQMEKAIKEQQSIAEPEPSVHEDLNLDDEIP